MEKFFKLKKYGTTVKTEIFAGITTFFAISYIFFVNPEMLSHAGMSRGGVFVAVVLASALGCLFMALYANVPFVQAPGMGLSAFFTYTICATMGFVWQEALAMVFICGLINITLALTNIRKRLYRAIPASITNAIGASIGIFVVYLGFKNAGFLTFTTDPGHYVDIGGTIISDSSIVPALTNFSDKGSLLAVIGIVVTVILMVKKVPASIFFGIIITTICGVLMGIISFEGAEVSNVSELASDLKEVSFAFFGNPGILSMFNTPEKALLSIMCIFAFSLSDTFDSIGTFIAAGRVGGIFNEEDGEKALDGKGFETRFEKALLADMCATSFSAVFGTSNVTTYVESSAGIGVGGRTGLTSAVAVILMLLCLPFSNVFGCIPSEAISASLIIVGVLMFEAVTDINWKSLDEAIPALMTLTVMTLAFNISYGIAAGFIFYCLIKIVTKKFEDISLLLGIATILFLINFVIQAMF